MLKHCASVSTGWRKWDLLTACTFYWTGSSDANNEAAASLSRSACQDRACADAPPTCHSTYSDIQKWQTGTCLCVDVNTQTHTHRLVEASGVGRVTADVFWYRLFAGECWVHWNAFTSEQHHQSRWPAGGRFWILKTVGHLLLCFPPSSLSAHVKGDEWGGRMRRLCVADSCQHKSCGFLTICSDSQCLTDLL